MANYYASSRTNYFKVKDLEKFKNELKTFGDELDIYTDSGDRGLCIIDNLGDGFPSDYYNEESEDYHDIDWGDFFSRHLVENHVAVIMEAGAEKLRYINGYASAYTWDGRSTHISLEEIYDKAIAEFGSDIKITEAVY